jgi:NADH-quinone oxidoreductase subunit A
MLFDFANVLVFTALGLGFVGVNLLIGKLLRPANPQTRKLSTYECGEPAVGSAWMNFNIRFYVVAFAVCRHSLSRFDIRLGQRRS